MLKHSIAGHTIDPESLLDDGVLCFDLSAAGQKTILVNHLHIVTSMNSQATELSCKLLAIERQHARSHYQNLNPSKPAFVCSWTDFPIDAACRGPWSNWLAWKGFPSQER